MQNKAEQFLIAPHSQVEKWDNWDFSLRHIWAKPKRSMAPGRVAEPLGLSSGGELSEVCSAASNKES